MVKAATWWFDRQRLLPPPPYIHAQLPPMYIKTHTPLTYTRMTLKNPTSLDVSTTSAASVGWRQQHRESNVSLGVGSQGQALLASMFNV